jgi:hypothetical protein
MTIPQDILKEAERYASSGAYKPRDKESKYHAAMRHYIAGAMAERQKLQQAVKPSTHVTP